MWKETEEERNQQRSRSGRQGKKERAEWATPNIRQVLETKTWSTMSKMLGAKTATGLDRGVPVQLYKMSFNGGAKLEALLEKAEGRTVGRSVETVRRKLYSSCAVKESEGRVAAQHPAISPCPPPAATGQLSRHYRTCSGLGEGGRGQTSSQWRALTGNQW